MSEIESRNWKFKYTTWYRLVESVFGENVPHLNDEEITHYVSNEDWIIIPIAGEKGKEQAKQAQRPNLFFDLSDKNKITFGITYDKLDSVRRLRNIISPFNEEERNEIIEKLATLDDTFLTKVYRKSKKNYWQESPSYEEAITEHSNEMGYERFVELFRIVDRIMDERDMLEKRKKYKLAPVINIVNAQINRDENEFKKALSKIKPLYEVTLRLRTREEFEKEIIDKKTQEIKAKQEAFAKYVEELKEKLKQNIISPEAYRNLVMEYKKRQTNN